MKINTSFIDRVIQHRPIAHLLFWCFFVVIFTLIASLNSGQLEQHLINYLAMLPSQLMAAYALNYYQVPQLLLKKKYLSFILSFLALAYVFSALARFCVVHIAEPFIRNNFEQESILEILTDVPYLFIIYFPGVYVIVFIMLIIKVFKERFEERHQIELLQKEKATNELKFLKAQIHPHFLFNTLNNLYALTLAKSDVAPTVVVKLSEMLDYILYQCNEPTIAVHKEIALIQDYIDLEKLRYGKRLTLTFAHQLDDSQATVAPLILLSFVENAFKHGAGGPAFTPEIHIDLKVQNQQLYFKVYNAKAYAQSLTQTDVQKNGIGTMNVQRQLELNYGDRYQLEITDTEDSYQIALSLDLK